MLMFGTRSALLLATTEFLAFNTEDGVGKAPLLMRAEWVEVVQAMAATWMETQTTVAGMTAYCLPLRDAQRVAAPASSSG